MRTVVPWETKGPESRQGLSARASLPSGPGQGVRGCSLKDKAAVSVKSPLSCKERTPSREEAGSQDPGLCSVSLGSSPP